MNAKTKMQRARISLLLDEPFFGSLLLGLTPKEDKEGNVTHTMATDGQSLWWHTKQVDAWTEAHIKTVLAHESLHCALLHPLRRGDRDNGAWNQACDYAVNAILEQCNIDAAAKGKPAPFQWPTDTKPLLDMTKAGQSAEELYSAPIKSQDSDQPQDGDGAQGMGEVKDSPAKDPAQKDAEEARWKKGLIDAFNSGKMRGSIPASMAKLVDDLLNPKASWQELLRRFIRDRAADDYSFSKPNTRYAASGFILPSLHSQRLGTIAIVRDTSGSTQDWQAEILAELSGLISECKPAKVIVVDADAEVQRVLELDSTDPLPTDAIGGGGTDFCPALERLEQFDPVCAVYLTDLQGSFPASEPSFPVLWATNSEQSAPFGETIRI